MKRMGQSPKILRNYGTIFEYVTGTMEGTFDWSTDLHDSARSGTVG
jgi:hypothetical protein